jgi:hypothetical protein
MYQKPLSNSLVPHTMDNNTRVFLVGFFFFVLVVSTIVGSFSLLRTRQVACYQTATRQSLQKTLVTIWGLVGDLVPAEMTSSYFTPRIWIRYIQRWNYGLPVHAFIRSAAVWCVWYHLLGRSWHRFWLRIVPFIWSGNRAHGWCDRSTGVLTIGTWSYLWYIQRSVLPHFLICISYRFYEIGVCSLCKPFYSMAMLFTIALSYYRPKIDDNSNETLAQW